jgi:hypothetical protein
MTRRRAAALLLWAMSSAPSVGLCASLRPLTLDELVDHSSEIVVGTVTGSEARWQGKLIVTRSTIHVEEPLKGQPSADVQVSQLGGTAVHPVIGKPVSMTVSSFVAFQPGEHVVVFLEPAPSGERQVVGAQQGKLVLREGAVPGEASVPVGPKALRVFRDGAHGTVMPEAMTLDALRDRIRARLRAAEGGRQ